MMLIKYKKQLMSLKQKNIHILNIIKLNLKQILMIVVLLKWEP